MKPGSSRAVFAITLLALLCPLTSVMAQSKDDVIAASDAAARTVVKAVIEEDADLLASVFTENGALIAPDGRRIQGRSTIKASATLLFLTLGGGELKTARLTLSVIDGTAYETGDYVFRKDKDKPAIKGKYVVVWKQEENRWKVAVVIGLE